MVRIAGFHPADPGSSPGVGNFPHWRNWIAHQTSNLGVVGSSPHEVIGSVPESGQRGVT